MFYGIGWIIYPAMKTTATKRKSAGVSVLTWDIVSKL